MNNDLNSSPTTIVPETPVQPVVPPVVTTVQTPVNAYNYASFGRRLLASLIDGVFLWVIGIIVMIPVTIITGLLMAGSNVGGDMTGIVVVTQLVQILVYVVNISYYIFFTGKWGQTLGKKAMGIKVVNQADGSVPGFGKGALRELIGKFVSAVVLLLGYFWMLWDKDKQTWHDKIAGTVVVKI